MTTKEKIKREIDKIPEDHLEELYHWIKDFEFGDRSIQKVPFLEKLREIKIYGPEDFSENIDHYLSGEVSASQNIH